MADINVPGIGPVKPVYLAGAAVVGVGGALYLVKRHKADTGAAASASSAPLAAADGTAGGDPYPADGTTGNPSDPYSTDPSTGETYGDEGSGYGYSAAEAAALQDYGSGGFLGDTGTSSGSSGTAASSPPATPQAWAQQVVSVLSGLGWGTQAVAAAVGAYIAGQSLTADEASIIQVALSEVPYPGSAPPVKVGSSTPSAAKPHAPTGLHSSPGPTTATVGFSAVSGATTYQVRAWDASRSPVTVIYDNTSADRSRTIPGLKPATKYGWHVAGINSAGEGAYSTEAHFTTSAAKAAGK